MPLQASSGTLLRSHLLAALLKYGYLAAGHTDSNQGNLETVTANVNGGIGAIGQGNGIFQINHKAFADSGLLGRDAYAVNLANIKQSNKINNTVTGDCGDNCGGVIAQGNGNTQLNIANVDQSAIAKAGINGLGVALNRATIDQGNLIQNTVDLKGCTTGNCETPLVVQGQGNTQKNTVGIKQYAQAEGGKGAIADNQVQLNQGADILNALSITPPPSP
ncbi:hypothetical protein N2152v2_000394 [Parachlorella kessleri]